MKNCINAIIKFNDLVNSVEDISVKIKRTKKSMTNNTIELAPIVLDENGKEYVLSLCCIDYGAGGCFYDWVDAVSFIFRVNEEQLEILKLLEGNIGIGVDNPKEFYTIGPSQNPDSKAFKNLKDVLSILGDAGNLLEQMKIGNDNLYSDVFAYVNEVPTE